MSEFDLSPRYASGEYAQVGDGVLFGQEMATVTSINVEPVYGEARVECTFDPPRPVKTELLQTRWLTLCYTRAELIRWDKDREATDAAWQRELRA